MMNMEHRLIRDLKSFTGDKREYRNWNEKLINAYVQIKKGPRGIFEWVKEQVEKGVNDMDQFKDAWDVEEFSDNYEFDGFGEELYCVLMDKCEGEALTKIRTAHEGQGIKAYFALHKWYSETTGEAISERIKQVMTPASPKQESEIADHIDRWLERMRILEQMRKEYELPGPFKITALRHLMIGKAKEYFEIVESRNPGDYERILPEIQEYANRRRLEANLKHESKNDSMDVGNVDTHDHGQECSSYWSDEANDMNAVGKGKGWKGK